MTTAQLRNQANDAAANGDYSKAADLMRKAVAAYNQHTLKTSA